MFSKAGFKASVSDIEPAMPHRLVFKHVGYNTVEAVPYDMPLVGYAKAIAAPPNPIETARKSAA